MTSNKSENTECPVCFDSVNDNLTDYEDDSVNVKRGAKPTVFTMCCSKGKVRNSICTTCYDKLVNSTNTCPFCRGKLESSREQKNVAPIMSNNDVARMYNFDNYNALLQSMSNDFNRGNGGNNLVALYRVGSASRADNDGWINYRQRRQNRGLYRVARRPRK